MGKPNIPCRSVTSAHNSDQTLLNVENNPGRKITEFLGLRLGHPSVETVFFRSKKT